MPHTLRHASTGEDPTPGTDRSIEAMTTRGAKRKKKSVIKRGQERLSDAVDMQIRKRILGRSEVTGEF